MEAPGQVTSATLVTTATTYLDAISRLDTSLLSSVLSHNYKHTFAPSSAGLGPPVGRDEFVSRFGTLRDVLRSYPIGIKQTWPNTSVNQVTVWADSEADFHPHVKNGKDDEWCSKGEYVFIFTMDTQGTKVEQAVEFVDSNATQGMRTLVLKAFEQIKER